MYCFKCGKELQVNDVFCDGCGANQGMTSQQSQSFSTQQNTSNITTVAVKKGNQKVKTVVIVSICSIVILGLVIFLLARPSAFENDLKSARISVLTSAEVIGKSYAPTANVAEAKRNRESAFLMSSMSFLNLAKEYPEEQERVLREWDLLKQEIKRQFPEAAKLLN